MERRQFIAGGAVAALSVSTLPIAAATANTTDRRAWNNALKAKERALDAWDAYGPEFDRVHKAWLANRPSMDSIDFEAFWPEHHMGDHGRNHIARTMDLEERWQTFLNGEGKVWWDNSGTDKTKKRYRAALDSVQAFRDAEEQHEIESGMKAADEEYNRLSEADGKALDKIMRLPAPDLAALRWKIDYLTTEGDHWDAWDTSFVRQTFADIARLMPPAA